MVDLILHILNEYIQAHKAIIGLVILGFMFAGFVMERFPAAVVAVLGACMFLFLGIIDSDGLFSVFSNTAPITIAAMFILSGALLRTGTIDAIAGFIIKRAKQHPKLAVAEMFLGAFVASAFMNNTPVVIVLIPIIIRLSRATGFSSKKLLIPLSFICILGLSDRTDRPPQGHHNRQAALHRSRIAPGWPGGHCGKKIEQLYPS